jgi:hypothetical protein
MEWTPDDCKDSKITFNQICRTRNLPSYNVTGQTCCPPFVTMLNIVACLETIASFIITSSEDYESSIKTQFLNLISYHTSFEAIEG